MRTILLFGSTGFIGEAIATYLKRKKNIHLITPTRTECNLLSYKSVKPYLDTINPDYVINAAYIEVNSNVKPTKKYLSDNLKISTNILKGCKKQKNIREIIYFGSGLEYGDSDEPIDEKHSTNPKNYYAKTKAIQSETSLRLAKKLRLPIILIKPFNLYGPYDTKSVFYYVIKAILEKKEFSITKGEQMRDILYIEDLVRLIEKIINKGETIRSGEVINVGFGKGVLLKDVVNEIIKLTNYKGIMGFRQYRPNEYFSQVANIDKAKYLFDWEPKTSLEEGLKKTIRWIKQG